MSTCPDCGCPSTLGPHPDEMGESIYVCRRCGLEFEDYTYSEENLLNFV